MLVHTLEFARERERVRSEEWGRKKQTGRGVIYLKYFFTLFVAVFFVLSTPLDDSHSQFTQSDFYILIIPYFPS